MNLAKLYDRETADHFQRIADDLGTTAEQIAEVVEHLARPVFFCSNHFSTSPNMERCHKAPDRGVCHINSEPLISLLSAESGIRTMERRIEATRPANLEVSRDEDGDWPINFLHSLVDINTVGRMREYLNALSNRRSINSVPVSTQP